jgi:hypothetical protein
MRFALLACVGVACGSSPKKPAADPHDAELDAAAARRKQIDAMAPPSPYEVRDRAAYRPAERCGQGPYRFETDALNTKYGEELIVYACGKHEIEGNYRITTKYKSQRGDSHSESAFGFRRDNAACKGREVASVTTGATTNGETHGGGGGGHGGTSTAAPATIKPISVERTTEIPQQCERTQVLHTSWISEEDDAPLDGHLVIDVWSDEPNDLEGLVFVVERSAVVADMTLERWKAYRAADQAYYKAYMANLDVDVKAGRTTLVDSTVKSPPPPAPRAEVQPPRPSPHARWISGYWFYEAPSFHWIDGIWDVPDEDVKRELTVQAPSPPPVAPARDEPIDPQPTATAVWTPGSWQWDGRGYIWIAGSWRIPPDANHTWQRATWSVRGRGAIFIPGGWRIRIGR